MRKWLAEDRAEPHALAFCAPPECRPGLVVSVIDLKGPDAAISEGLLKDPSRLAQALRKAEAHRKVQTIVSTARLDGPASQGFAISLAPSDGGKAPAYGATLGRRSGDTLKLVLVIGDDRDAVLTTVRQVAGHELAP